jgi:hypothetical protein
VDSQPLELVLQSGFDAKATLDLSAHNHVVSVDKPPVKLPAAARMTRLAQWGSGPYQYTSSDPAIASVDEQTGEVSARRNGACTISATDSQSQTRTYPLTVKGIVEVHFLTDSADWQGMLRLCETAKLQPVTLSRIKRMWTLYFPDAGPVADYLEWLNYPVWTGDELVRTKRTRIGKSLGLARLRRSAKRAGGKSNARCMAANNQIPAGIAVAQRYGARRNRPGNRAVAQQALSEHHGRMRRRQPGVFLQRGAGAWEQSDGQILEVRGGCPKTGGGKFCLSA